MELITKPHVIEARFNGECVFREFITPRIGVEDYHAKHFDITKKALAVLRKLEGLPPLDIEE